MFLFQNHHSFSSNMFWALAKYQALCYLTGSSQQPFYGFREKERAFLVCLRGAGHIAKYFMDIISCNHGHLYPHFKDKETNLI